MKNITLLIIAFLLISCKQKSGKYYFEFDSVDWFSIDIDENKVFPLLNQSDLTENQKLLLDLVLNEKPYSETDTLFLEQLDKIGFEKLIIKNPEKLKGINEIFREKPHRQSIATACAAVYRDILVFRNKKRIVGVVKICFDCLKSQIHGTSVNTAEFGQSGDYGNLLILLKE